MAAPTGKSWTPAEDAELRRQWKAGVRVKSIQIPGRSRQGIQKRSTRLDLPSRALRLLSSRAIHISTATHDRLRRTAALKGVAIIHLTRTLLEKALDDMGAPR